MSTTPRYVHFSGYEGERGDSLYGIMNDPWLYQRGIMDLAEVPKPISKLALEDANLNMTDIVNRKLQEGIERRMDLYFSTKTQEVINGQQVIQLAISPHHPRFEYLPTPIIHLSPTVPPGEVWMWDPQKQEYVIVHKWEEEFDMEDYNEALAEGAFDD